MESDPRAEGNDPPTLYESLPRTIRRIIREELQPLNELIRTVLGPERSKDVIGDCEGTVGDCQRSMEKG